MDAATAAPDRFVIMLRSSVEQAADAQLERYAEAGLACSREKALSIAIEQHQQMFIHLAGRLENKGRQGWANVFRELADLLPDVMLELGLR